MLDKIKTFIPVLLLLTKKYASVVANPPYMGQKSMNGELKQYVNAQYPLTKSDLFAVFMDVGLAMNVKHGLMGMINQHSWMFTSTYKELRASLLTNNSIHSMLHLGTNTFEELKGEIVQSTAFVIERSGKTEKVLITDLLPKYNSQKGIIILRKTENLSRCRKG